MKRSTETRQAGLFGGDDVGAKQCAVCLETPCGHHHASAPEVNTPVAVLCADTAERAQRDPAFAAALNGMVQAAVKMVESSAPEGGDVVMGQYAGTCFKAVPYESGRVAVEPGACEVERTPSMDIVRQRGSQRYCFFRNSVSMILGEYIELGESL